MLFIILVVVCLICGAIWGYNEGFGDFGLGALGSIMGGLIGLLASLIIGLFVYGFFGGSAVEVENIDSYEIQAIADNQQLEGRVSGTIFIVQGTIDSTLKYNYMYEIEGKGFAYGSVNASDSYLNTTDESPRLDIVSYKYSNDILEFFCPYIGGNEYIFYLPPDAEVVDDYVIDWK